MRISRLLSGFALATVGVSVAAALGTGAAATYYVRRSKAKAFEGKVVVITGASRGLGLALAEEFGRRGAILCLTARNSSELAQAVSLLADRGIQNPDQTFAVPADLRNPDQCEQFINHVLRQFGRIDVLVNNAGVISVGPVENQTIDAFREIMDANFFAGVQCSMHALPSMLSRREGAIVNIASIGGKIAVPHLLPYTASKFAVVGFSEGLHAEMRSKGVHVMTVSPGLMRTGSHLRALFSGDAPREYRWFSLLANTPGLSISAGMAARKIVHALHSREAEITITPAAAVATPVAQLFPRMTAFVSSIVCRLLPAPLESAGSQQNEGREVRQLEPALVNTIGSRAARRYNQLS